LTVAPDGIALRPHQTSYLWGRAALSAVPPRRPPQERFSPEKPLRLCRSSTGYLHQSIPANLPYAGTCLLLAWFPSQAFNAPFRPRLHTFREPRYEDREAKTTKKPLRFRRVSGGRFAERAAAPPPIRPLPLRDPGIHHAELRRIYMGPARRGDLYEFSKGVVVSHVIGCWIWPACGDTREILIAVRRHPKPLRPSFSRRRTATRTRPDRIMQ